MDSEERVALELALEKRLGADLDALAVRPYVYYREAVMQRRATKPGVIGRSFSVAHVGATIVVAVLFALAAAFALLNLRGPSPAVSPTPVSPSPTPRSSPAPFITVTPTEDATIPVNTTRTYTATISNLSGCVDIAFVDANTYPGDGTFRNAGNGIAELSSDAAFRSINGVAVGVSVGTGYFGCVPIPSDGKLTFTIDSGTVNAFVRPLVFHDEPQNYRFNLDTNNRPTDVPWGVGGATRFVARSSPTTGPAVQPAGYQLPSECAYVGEAERREATTFWLVKCPVGLLSRALAPSLAAQGWESCDAAGGVNYYRKGDLLILITNFVDRSDATGELGEKTRTGSCGP
jgi:hypothetical protein